MSMLFIPPYTAATEIITDVTVYTIEEEHMTNEQNKQQAALPIPTQTGGTSGGTTKQQNQPYTPPQNQHNQQSKKQQQQNQSQNSGSQQTTQYSGSSYTASSKSVESTVLLLTIQYIVADSRLRDSVAITKTFEAPLNTHELRSRPYSTWYAQALSVIKAEVADRRAVLIKAHAVNGVVVYNNGTIHIDNLNESIFELAR